MYRAVIIYAPDDEQMGGLARRVESSLDRDSFEVETKIAGQAAIPDLAAADLIILGSRAAAEDPIHSDFSEILRALSGITLAGRVAGVFSAAGVSTLAAFRRALQDCELALPERNFLNLSGEHGPEIERWTAELVGQLEAQSRGR